MDHDQLLRDWRATDDRALAALYAAAFPEENLLPLVTRLHAEADGLVSRVALVGGTLAGHVAFTFCEIADRPERAALLGPLAVHPQHQRKGIGRALVETSRARLQEARIARILVLGDPAYYGRLGFTTETGITPPYPLPEDWRGAWQGAPLFPRTAPLAGTLLVPAPWRDPALWTS